LKELFYHYCSIQNLFSIINNKSLWLTSLKSGYDKDELKSTYDIAKRLIQKNLLPSVELEKDEKIFTNNEYYCLSCTTESDSYFHFDSYGDNLYGVSIGINPDVLNSYYLKILESSPVKYELPIEWLAFQKVVYNITEQQQLFIDTFSKLVTENIEHKENNQNFEVANIELTIRSLRALFKKKNYESEKEVRLVYYPNLYKISSDFKRWFQDYKPSYPIDLYHSIPSITTEIRRNPHVKLYESLSIQDQCEFSMFGKDIRSYIKINVSKLLELGFIDTIIIGPKATQSRNDLKNFLILNGLNNINVIESDLHLK